MCAASRRVTRAPQKPDLALVLEPAPRFTGDVGGAFAHLPERLPSRTVAKILRVSSAKLTGLGLVVDAEHIVERGALVDFFAFCFELRPALLARIFMTGSRFRRECRTTRPTTRCVCYARHDGLTGI